MLSAANLEMSSRIVGLERELAVARDHAEVHKASVRALHRRMDEQLRAEAMLKEHLHTAGLGLCVRGGADRLQWRVIDQDGAIMAEAPTLVALWATVRSASAEVRQPAAPTGGFTDYRARD